MVPGTVFAMLAALGLDFIRAHPRFSFVGFRVFRGKYFWMGCIILFPLWVIPG